MAVPKPSLFVFIRSFGTDWADYMSGGPSVPAAILAFYVENRWAQAALWLTAAFCIILTAYRMWYRERLKIGDLEGQIQALEDRLTPKLRVTFKPDANGIVAAMAKTQVFHSMSAHGGPIMQEKQTPSKYLRLTLEAVGVQQLAEVFLVGLSRCRSNENHFQEITIPQPLPLRGTSFLVRPDIPEYADFAVVSATNVFSAAPDIRWPHILEGILGDAARYRFTFRATSDGITAAPVVVEVNWSGNWSHISAQQILTATEA
jgi:hypothetical protein